MVLLDVLSRKPGVRLIVAHFDHGIRADSAEDRKLVQAAAAAYGLPFAYEEGKLGPRTSEGVAREARYEFLHRMQRQYKANAIITAHHGDDMLETAILNIVRGTGRKGLVSLADREKVRRPLLGYTKKAIRAYAVAHQILWREDSTNANDQYLRNYIRHQIMPHLGEASRQALRAIIERTRITDADIDAELRAILRDQTSADVLDRRAFAMLPHDAARELLVGWLRHNNVTGFDARTIERVVIAAKIQGVGKAIDVIGGYRIRVQKRVLALEHLER
jgi:tRNA(Ile)-lysidine synthase